MNFPKPTNLSKSVVFTLMLFLIPSVSQAEFFLEEIEIEDATESPKEEKKSPEGVEILEIKEIEMEPVKETPPAEPKALDSLLEESPEVEVKPNEIQFNKPAHKEAPTKTTEQNGVEITEIPEVGKSAEKPLIGGDLIEVPEIPSKPLDKSEPERVKPTEHPVILILSGKGKDLEISAEIVNLATNAILPEDARLLLPQTLQKSLGSDTNITPLMAAAALDDHELAQKLMDAGAKTGATSTRWKFSPLAVACHVGAYKTGRVLLKEPTSENFKVTVSISTQTVTAYAKNVEIFTSAISTGKSSHPTPTGSFIITEKYGPKKISTLYGANMPYFMRLNFTAVGLHAGELPGYPASKGCIRKPLAKAQELNRLVPRGTLVEIVN